jgi:methionyl-tRNA formyltransferase
VKLAAESGGIPVATPERASDALAEIAAARPDVGVVVAFGQLLRPDLLDTPPLGCVNVHYSLLPRWRGAAPVERAILAGDAETGVCIMQVDEGLDTGPVYATATTRIHRAETAGELRARLVTMGNELLVETLPRLESTRPEEQRGEATYATKLDVGEFGLDPHRSAAELERMVRAANPNPGAWCRVGGRRVKVWRAAAAAGTALGVGTIDSTAVLHTVDGGLQLLEVQPEGKPIMEATAWRNGRPGELALDPPV